MKTKPENNNIFKRLKLILMSILLALKQLTDKANDFEEHPSILVPIPVTPKLVQFLIYWVITIFLLCSL